MPLCAVVLGLGVLAPSGFWTVPTPSFPSLVGYEVAFWPFVITALVAIHGTLAVDQQ